MPNKSDLPPVPPALADVALVDGPTAASAAGMSLSTFLDEVRRRIAPAPVIRAPRCSRWRLRDIRAWLIERAERGIANVATAEATVEKATKASRQAQTPQARAKARATRAARAYDRSANAP